MNVQRTALPGVLILEPKVFADARGFFMESYNKRVFESVAGIREEFVQDNHSRSVKGTLRGLHYQLQQPQGKLLRVISGEIYDVAVDLRRHHVVRRMINEGLEAYTVPPVAVGGGSVVVRDYFGTVLRLDPKPGTETYQVGWQVAEPGGTVQGQHLLFDAKRGLIVLGVWAFSEQVLLILALVYASSGPVSRLVSKIRPHPPAPKEVHAS